LNNRIFIVCLAAVLLCSCAGKKRVVKPTEPSPEGPELMVDTVAQWQTAKVTNSTLTLNVNELSYSVACQMQTVRDSMIVISIMPMLNMELLRIEVTPDTAYVIDKVNHRYTRLPLSAAQEEVVPALRWNDLQDFASGSQTGENTSLGYSFRALTVRLKAIYGTVEYDVPVNVKHLQLERYEFVDINTLLR